MFALTLKHFVYLKCKELKDFLIKFWFGFAAIILYFLPGQVLVRNTDWLAYSDSPIMSTLQKASVGSAFSRELVYFFHGFTFSLVIWGSLAVVGFILFLIYALIFQIRKSIREKTLSGNLKLAKDSVINFCYCFRFWILYIVVSLPVGWLFAVKLFKWTGWIKPQVSYTALICALTMESWIVGLVICGVAFLLFCFFRYCIFEFFKDNWKEAKKLARKEKGMFIY